MTSAGSSKPGIPEAPRTAPRLRSEAKPSVTVLTGFLGSGKTTLINHILGADHGRRIAVIVNEAGEIGIDADLIVSSDEEIVELANGCICCTLRVRSDLADTLLKLLERPDPPDYFLIETSGMADPAPAVQALFAADLIDRVAVDGIVTIVDACHIGRRLDEPDPGRYGSLAVDQIVCADRIVVNKLDLVTEEACRAVERRIRTLNNTAPLIRSRFAQVDPDELLGIDAFGRWRLSAEGSGILDDPRSRTPGIEATSLEVRGDLDEARLTAWLKDLVEDRSADIYRLKGILAVAGRPGQMVLQGVHSIYELYTGGPWPGRRSTRLVIIGKGFDEDALRSELEGCRA